MSTCTEFLSELGFGEIVEDMELTDEYDIELNGSIYEKNITLLKDEFDDEFIVDMFLCYNAVLLRSDFAERLHLIKKQFDTDMWGTLVQYEWNETGGSSVFHLMDFLEVGYFEAHLAEVCDKVRSLWVADYGEDEL